MTGSCLTIFPLCKYRLQVLASLLLPGCDNFVLIFMQPFRIPQEKLSLVFMLNLINQVVGIENEAKFILALQEERSAVALAVFLFNDTSTAEEKVSLMCTGMAKKNGSEVARILRQVHLFTCAGVARGLRQHGRHHQQDQVGQLRDRQDLLLQTQIPGARFNALENRDESRFVLHCCTLA